MQNIYASDWDSEEDHTGYRWHRIRLGRRLGASKLGASVYVLSPGQRSFPYHYHHANEEMLVVLEGALSVRTPDGAQDAGPGDAVVFPAGESGAHQVINVSDEPARFMMISTMIEPEIAEYPDSGQIGVFAGRAPGASGEARLQKFLDGSAEVDYFEGG